MRALVNNIRCPICGAVTSVTETRAILIGIRRRRRCTAIECKGRLTTYELPIADPRRLRGHAMTLVPIKQLNAIAAMIDKLREE